MWPRELGLLATCVAFKLRCASNPFVVAKAPRRVAMAGPAVGRAELERLRDEWFCDDVLLPAGSEGWRTSEVIALFSSGGLQLHASSATCSPRRRCSRRHQYAKCGGGGGEGGQSAPAVSGLHRWCEPGGSAASGSGTGPAACGRAAGGVPKPGLAVCAAMDDGPALALTGHAAPGRPRPSPPPAHNGAVRFSGPGV